MTEQRFKCMKIIFVNNKISFRLNKLNECWKKYEIIIVTYSVKLGGKYTKSTDLSIVDERCKGHKGQRVKTGEALKSNL